jgi:uncharacterized membrane protein
MTAHTVALALHVATASVGLTLGPIIMRAPKRPGRHTQLGTIYHWNMLALASSAVALALLDLHRLWGFIPLAVFSYGNAFVGYVAVRRRRPGWLPFHIGGMGGSYIALVTAFLVVNAPGLGPIAWFGPSIVGSMAIGTVVAGRSAAVKSR